MMQCVGPTHCVLLGGHPNTSAQRFRVGVGCSAWGAQQRARPRGAARRTPHAARRGSIRCPLVWGGGPYATVWARGPGLANAGGRGALGRRRRAVGAGARRTEGACAVCFPGREAAQGTEPVTPPRWDGGGAGRLGGGVERRRRPPRCRCLEGGRLAVTLLPWEGPVLGAGRLCTPSGGGTWGLPRALGWCAWGVQWGRLFDRAAQEGARLAGRGQCALDRGRLGRAPL